MYAAQSIFLFFLVCFIIVLFNVLTDIRFKLKRGLVGCQMLTCSLFLSL